MDNKEIETKTAKISFEFPTEGCITTQTEIFPITNQEDLNRAIKGLGQEKFPLLNNGETSIVGELGKTGVTIVTDYNNEKVVVAALPHPKTRPKQIIDGKIEFGSPPTNLNLEPALEKPIGMEKASEIARILIKTLKECPDFSTFSSLFNGLGAIGSEPEAWVIDPKTGNLAEISGGELQEGLIEETLEAISDPLEFLIKRSKHVLDRAKRYPNFVIDTSVLPTSNPSLLKVNTGHDLGPYVLAIQRYLWENYFSFSTPEAVEIMNQVARSDGFNNIQELHQSLDHMAYWAMAASHASIGLPHLRTGNKAMWVPTELAIAVSDIFNSDLATVAEFLMFSTPLVFGQTPTLNIDDKVFWPNDYRAILRYLIDTSNPGPFIENSSQMYQRIIYGITQGLTHTMDRASYLSEVNGKIVPVAHGRVRNRIASTEPRNLTGRVEYTGCSASPSIIDELARNCFLQVLTIAAIEALANKQMPQDYFSNHFPSIGSWERQKDLAIKASLQGFSEPEVFQLINETLNFLTYMEENYQVLEPQIKIAKQRVQNLTQDAVFSLEDYLRNPRGPISRVVKNEIQRGVEPIELVGRIHNYELELAQRLLQNPFYWL
ncbi:MAG: hypothetical protein ACPLRN_00365 [Microgenomates group bacterium]